jgi:very-short-patch-repair endonuclease
LIIEADGKIDDKADVKEHDVEREKHLTEMGYKVKTFTNEVIKNRMENVLAEIKEKVEAMQQSQIIN